MTTLTYCANGCTRNGDTPITTEPPSRICGRCEDNLRGWLRDIPTRYALLPTFIGHGTAERNPDSKATKRAEAAAPMRLEILDLLDTRYGRRWQGTAPTADRRGIIGTLKVHVDRLRDERPLTADHNDTSVTVATNLLTRHLLWLTEQEWISELYADLKTLNRQLSDAVGDYRRPPVGRCHITNEDDDTCNGGLYANPYGGVRCSRCGATWDAAHLRQLGLAQAAQETA